MLSIGAWIGRGVRICTGEQAEERGGLMMNVFECSFLLCMTLGWFHGDWVLIDIQLYRLLGPAEAAYECLIRMSNITHLTISCFTMV